MGARLPAPSGTSRSPRGGNRCRRDEARRASRRRRSAISRRSKPGRKYSPPVRPEKRSAGRAARSSDLVGAQGTRSLECSRRSTALGRRVRQDTRLHRASLRSVEPRRGVAAPTVARVAHLARRAHEAIRGTSRSALEAAYTDGARVLHLGLPSALRRRISLEVTIDAIPRNMRREADGWVAVVEATMLLVG